MIAGWKPIYTVDLDGGYNIMQSSPPPSPLGEREMKRNGFVNGPQEMAIKEPVDLTPDQQLLLSLTDHSFTGPSSSSSSLRCGDQSAGIRSK